MLQNKTSTLLSKIKKNLILYINLSLVLGIVGIIGSTYIIQRFYWYGTNYGISDCRVQAAVEPSKIVRGNSKIPPLGGCTGVEVGWPAAFAKSDIAMLVGVNNPHTPVPVNELFGLSNIVLSLPKFLIDWLLWSVVGFIGICLCSLRKR